MNSLCALESSVLYVGEVNADRVNVRTGPHKNHTVLYVAPLGKEVFVLEEAGDWLKVDLPKEASIWIYAQLVEKSLDHEGVVLKDGVNLRAKPSTKAFIVGQVHKGQELELRGEKFGWYKIGAPEGVCAWISKPYVTKGLNYSDYVKEQRFAKVRLLYQEVESLHNQEWLKPREDRDCAFLLEKYKYLMDHFDGFPEAKLAERRYSEVIGWLAKEDWDALEANWKTFMDKDELAPEESQGLIAKYEQFMKKYPQNVYITIVEDRLNFLKKRPIMEEPLNGADDLRLSSKESILKGVIYDLGRIMNRPATHKLMRDGEIVCLLRSSTLDLEDYIYRNVEIKGVLVEVKGWNIPTLEVQRVKVNSWKGRF